MRVCARAHRGGAVMFYLGSLVNDGVGRMERRRIGGGIMGVVGGGVGVGSGGFTFR